MMRVTSLAVLLGVVLIVAAYQPHFTAWRKQPEILSAQKELQYWMLLERKSQKEYLYVGEPGDRTQSELVRTFKVKTGVRGEKPTPLPQLVGREYWVIEEMWSSQENPETAPYFLALDVPVGEVAPFGPEPYMECNGQCNWQLPGRFGLHGVNGNLEKLADVDAGSSGCVRHADEDITYLFHLLHAFAGDIRYYVQDV